MTQLHDDSSTPELSRLSKRAGSLGRTLQLSLLAAGLAALSACSMSYHARNAEDYRQATRALLESRQSDFKQCYEGVLATTPDASGSVAVQFVLEEKTGKILTPSSLPESTAPEPLRQCVVNALGGLALDPPDQRKGIATMTFDFGRG
jgi:hypothetical protein